MEDLLPKSDMSLIDLPPIPRFIHPALASEPTLVSEALAEGLLDPRQLDPTRREQVEGLTRAAKTHPHLPFPPALLAAMTEFQLWDACPHPAVAAHLAQQLRQHGTSYSFRRGFIAVPETLPTEVEGVLVELAASGRLTAEQQSELHGLRAVSEPGRAAILTAIRSRASKKAAATRKERTQRTSAPQGSPTPPSATSPTSAPRKIDPLLAAIRSGDPGRLSYFALDTLDPARVKAVLPEWLSAPDGVQALLLKVRGLPLEAKRDAIEAWATSEAWVSPADPIELCLLDRLSPAAADKVLSRFLHNWLRLEPAPNEAALQNALFRLALDNPSQATWLAQGFRLHAWLGQLTSLASPDGRREIPQDPEARWIQLVAKGTASVTRAMALALLAAFPTWPANRQQALAPPLSLIAQRAILAQ